MKLLLTIILAYITLTLPLIIGCCKVAQKIPTPTPLDIPNGAKKI
jgi:hypothetical protein